MTRRGRSFLLLALGIAAAVAVALLAVAGLGPRPGASLPPLPTGPTPSPIAEPLGARVLVGAGDIADCGSLGDEATARLVEGVAGTVLTTGDNAYPSGSLQQYRECYDPSWGRFRERTRPVPGNHEYEVPRAQGYFEYFGPSVGSPDASWYAYDLGSWRVYALDSNCAFIGGCGADSAQVAWLREDLADEPRDCVLAYWHHPRFSSGRHGSDPAVDGLWVALADASADVVVTGHDHLYERFAPLDEAGDASETGIRSFVVGTGGRSLYEFHDVLPASEVRHAATFGVIVLTLRDGSYEWRFVPTAGADFTDAGSGRCH